MLDLIRRYKEGHLVSQYGLVDLDLDFGYYVHCLFLPGLLE